MNIAHLIAVSKTIAGLYLVLALMYTGFLAYCTLRQMRDSGRLAQMPRIARAHCWMILYFFLFLDVMFNLTVGTLLYAEMPELRKLTFTMRCKKHLQDGGWSGRVARFVCYGWLNPGEPGHC